MNSNNLRALTDREHGVITKLLEQDFPGNESLLEQVNNSLVTVIDENGSLKFEVKIASKANVEKRIPVEAELTDVDGMTAHFLLHVVDGKLFELEIYKDDSSRLLHWPEPKELHVFRLSPMPLEKGLFPHGGASTNEGDKP